MSDWIIEIRKTFDPETKDLALDLFKFSEKGSTENLGNFPIANLGETEKFFRMFNFNSECLFNHLFVDNSLFFFNMNKKKNTVSLEEIKLDDLSDLQADNTVDIPIDNDGQEDATLLGATFVKGIEEHNNYSLDKHHNALDHNAYKSNYFALIFCRTSDEDSNKIQLLYDLRHLSKPDKSILVIDSDQNLDEFDVSLVNKQPVLLKIPAEKIFYQLLLTEEITDREIKDIKKNMFDKHQRSHKDPRLSNSRSSKNMSKKFKR